MSFRRRKHRYYPPHPRVTRSHVPVSTILKFSILLPLVLAIICVVALSFAGVEPLASVKDKVLTTIADPFVLDEEETKVIALEAFDLINAERTEVGAPVLQWDPELAKLAEAWSNYMQETRDFRHSGYPYAECIVEGWGSNEFSFLLSGEDVISPWSTSPSHWQILMDKTMHYGAVGVAGDDYATFLMR
jgi:uncharacterized protein YkwD